jgi:hypothetical protein
MVYQTAYDTYPLQTRAWKREHLPTIAREGCLLAFPHDPDCFAALVAPDEKAEFVVAQELRVPHEDREERARS